MADNDKERFSKESLKAVEDFIKKTESAKQNLKDMNEFFGNMATQLFGISGSAFFKEVPKTTEELRAQKKAISEIKNELDKSFENIGDALGKQFESALSKLEAGPKPPDMSKFESAFGKLAADLEIEFTNIADLEQKILDTAGESSKEFKDFSKLKEEFRSKEEEYRDANEDFYDKILEQNDELFAHLSDQERKQKLMELHQVGFNSAVAEGSELIRDMAMYSDGVEENIAQAAMDADNLRGRLAEAEAEANSMTKSTFSMGAGFKDAAKNLARDIIPKMLEYDQAISDAGKNFGFVGMKSKETSMAMAEMGQSAARFNLSMKDAVAMMGGLGEELATINEIELAGIVEKLASVEKATGLSADETNRIAGEMMRAGQSADEVAGFMEYSNKMSKMFGVNTKKVLQGVSRNIDKMRQMGFQGGEESLTRMVVTAERLRMNVDEIFDVAKRARTIEGAMDMAAELQLAGGSFANINPMDLLAAARKGPEELQKILTQMGDDIGTWNKETGEFEFDPIDVDRLQMVADATGQSMDSIQKMIQKNAEDAKKAEFMPDLTFGEVMGPDGKPLDQSAMQNMISDSVNLDGTIKEGSLLDEAGIESLEDLTSDQATMLIQKKMDEEKTLAEQAEANQSFQDSITAFKDAIFNLFTVFEPFIKILTSFIQTINGMPGPIKALVAGLIGFAMIAPKLGMALNGFKAMAGGAKGLVGKLTGGGGGGAGGAMQQGMGGAQQTAGAGLDGKAGEAQKGFFTKLAEGIKKFGEVKYKDILKFGASLAIIGLAITGFMYALSMTGDPSLSQFVGAAASLLILGGAMFMLSKIKVDTKSLLKMSLAMAIVGAALIPFAYAAQMMVGVDWLSVLAGVGILALIMAGLVLIGVMLTGPQIIALLIAAAALAIVGVALMAFGYSMLLFSEATQNMQGMEFGWLLDMGLNLILAAPMLLLGGLMGALAAPMLLVTALGIGAIAAVGLLVSQVDWSAFQTMGSALMGIVPSLIGFGLAGLMFINPILLFGMLAMIGTLAGLAVVMIPLAESLPAAADGLDRMADGLERLMDAASSLDMDKLEALRSLSWSMAIAGIGGGIMGDSINKIAEALAKLTKIGEGGKGGGTTKIQVDLKLNGRDLQSIIVDDTEIVT